MEGIRNNFTALPQGPEPLTEHARCTRHKSHAIGRKRKVWRLRSCGGLSLPDRLTAAIRESKSDGLDSCLAECFCFHILDDTFPDLSATDRSPLRRSMCWTPSGAPIWFRATSETYRPHIVRSPHCTACSLAICWACATPYCLCARCCYGSHASGQPIQEDSLWSLADCWVSSTNVLSLHDVYVAIIFTWRRLSRGSRMLAYRQARRRF